MPTNTELQSELDGLKKLLRNAGLLREPRPANRQTDYIEFGSPRHAALLGLVEVKDTEREQAQKDGYTLYIGKSGRVWRLDDEIAALRHYPGIDPPKAILVVLRQKVNEIESGPPKVPEDAPPMFDPAAYTG